MVRLCVWTRHCGLRRMVGLICGQILYILFVLMAHPRPEAILRIACVYEALIYFGSKGLHGLLLLDLSSQTVTILIAFRVHNSYHSLT